MIWNIASIINSLIKDWFVVKGKIQDLIDNRDVSLPLKLVKVLANLLELIEGPLEGNYLEAPKRSWWSMDSTNKRREWTIAKVAKWEHPGQREKRALLRSLRKKKAKAINLDELLMQNPPTDPRRVHAPRVVRMVKKDEDEEQVLFVQRDSNQYWLREAERPNKTKRTNQEPYYHCNIPLDLRTSHDDLQSPRALL